MRRKAVPTIGTVVFIVVALVATACGGDSTSNSEPAGAGPPEASTTSTPAGTSSTSSTTTPVSEEEAILAAVDGFIVSTIRVNDPPDPSHPELERYRTGEVLTAAVRNVEENQRAGVSYRLPPNAQYRHQATVLSTLGTEAIVRNCIVDDAIQVHADGRVVNSATVTKLFTMRLVVVEGQWKVAENRTLERWDGIAGCATAG